MAHLACLSHAFGAHRAEFIACVFRIYTLCNFDRNARETCALVFVKGSCANDCVAFSVVSSVDANVDSQRRVCWYITDFEAKGTLRERVLSSFLSR